MIDERQLITELELEIGETYNSDICYGLKRAIEIVEHRPLVGKWISCSERLPEEESLLYWTTHEDGSVVLHGYTKRNGFIYNWEVDDLEKRKRQGDVIAWTPIFYPEPYKGE